MPSSRTEERGAGDPRTALHPQPMVEIRGVSKTYRSPNGDDVRALGAEW